MFVGWLVAPAIKFTPLVLSCIIDPPIVRLWTELDITSIRRQAHTHTHTLVRPLGSHLDLCLASRRVAAVFTLYRTKGNNLSAPQSPLLTRLCDSDVFAVSTPN